MEAAKETEQSKRELEDSRAETKSWKFEGVRIKAALREREGGMEVSRTGLVKIENEVENVEMGGTGSPSKKIIVNAVTNTEKKTYTVHERR